ncbi:MAG: hypothetical protein LBF92_00075 [Synergistaceae bacterium]|jgi:hypothetical protein|nr:hypothetical protein [Synergistaceae bacterium]
MRRWKARLILLSFLCGALYFADQRYDYFRLRGLEIAPAGILQDTTVWQSLPRVSERFWPSLFWEKRGFAREIEGAYPVEIRLTASGWGRYKVSIIPLEPMLYVSWNSDMWLLSKNGRMWRTDLPSNASVKGLKLPDKPILAWDSGLATPIDPDAQGGGIFRSSLPLTKIKKWYDMLEKVGWEDDIYCVLAKKIDGRPVVQLLLGSGDGQPGEVVLKEDTANWSSIAAAMAKVFSGAAGPVPKGLVVNATYADSMTFTVTSRDNR